MFSMITNRNEAIALVKHIFQVIPNANSVVQLANHIKTKITKHANVSVRIIVHAEKIIAGILAHALVRMISI